MKLRITIGNKMFLPLTSLITASILMQLTSDSINEKNKSQIIRKYITKILLSDLGEQILSYSLVYDDTFKIKINENISRSY